MGVGLGVGTNAATVVELLQASAQLEDTVPSVGQLLAADIPAPLRPRVRVHGSLVSSDSGSARDIYPTDGSTADTADRVGSVLTKLEAERAIQLEVQAATCIQSAFRALKARRTANRMRNERVSHQRVRERAATTIQSAFRGCVTRKQVEKDKAEAVQAATTIQARFKGFLARKVRREKEQAAVLIQARFKGYMARKKHGDESSSTIKGGDEARGEAHVPRPAQGRRATTAAPDSFNHLSSEDLALLNLAPSSPEVVSATRRLSYDSASLAATQSQPRPQPNESVLVAARLPPRPFGAHGGVSSVRDGWAASLSLTSAADQRTGISGIIIGGGGGGGGGQLDEAPAAVSLDSSERRWSMHDQSSYGSFSSLGSHGSHGSPQPSPVGSVGEGSFVGSIRAGSPRLPVGGKVGRSESAGELHTGERSSLGGASCGGGAGRGRGSNWYAKMMSKARQTKEEKANRLVERGLSPPRQTHVESDPDPWGAILNDSEIVSQAKAGPGAKLARKSSSMPLLQRILALREASELNEANDSASEDGERADERLQSHEADEREHELDEASTVGERDDGDGLDAGDHGHGHERGYEREERSGGDGWWDADPTDSEQLAEMVIRVTNDSPEPTAAAASDSAKGLDAYGDHAQTEPNGMTAEVVVPAGAPGPTGAEPFKAFALAFLVVFAVAAAAGVIGAAATGHGGETRATIAAAAAGGGLFVALPMTCGARRVCWVASKLLLATGAFGVLALAILYAKFQAEREID
jgi:hypothetical protein